MEKINSSAQRNKQKSMRETSITVCFDENYVFNGAMNLYSASQNIRDGIKIKAYIIDGSVKKECNSKNSTKKEAIKLTLK